MNIADSRHLVLIGMMGVGKSTVGRALARALGRPFLDSDDAVEARTGRTVADIFAADGEAAFRAVEAEVMAALLDDPRPSVIAAAGGSVLDAGTRERLRSAGTVVWLCAPVDVLVGRTARGAHRPALAEDREGTLSRLDTERSAIYAGLADARVDATAPVDAVVDAILTLHAEEVDR